MTELYKSPMAKEDFGDDELEAAAHFRGRTTETVNEGDMIAMFPFGASVLEKDVDERLTA